VAHQSFCKIKHDAIRPLGELHLRRFLERLAAEAAMAFRLPLVGPDAKYRGAETARRQVIAAAENLEERQ
jgi:hypothetical protein